MKTVFKPALETRIETNTAEGEIVISQVDGAGNESFVFIPKAYADIFIKVFEEAKNDLPFTPENGVSK